MRALWLAPPVIALLLLAAHFFRAGNDVALLASLLAFALVFVRRPWAARTLQAALLLGAAEWLRSAVSLVLARKAMGEPFLRLALILGAVAAFTALSALAFQTAGLRARFGLGPAAKTGEGRLGQ